MKYNRSIYFCIVFLLISCFSFVASAKTTSSTKQLHILFTSDIHGSFNSQLLRPKAHIGLEYLAKIIQSRRKKYKNIVLLDGGDLLYGSAFSFYHFFIKKDIQNYPIIKLFTSLHYDAWVVGNHDFQVPILSIIQKKQIEPLPLGANIGNTKLFKPYVILNKQKLHIAVLGFITPATPMWSLSVPNSLEFKDIVKEAKYWVSYVKEKEKPDVIILLFHSGTDMHYDAMASKLNHRPLANSAGLALRQIKGVHLALIGHTHKLYPYKNNQRVRYINHVPIVSAGAHAQALQEIVLQLQLDNKKWVVTKTKVIVYKSRLALKKRQSKKEQQKTKLALQKKHHEFLRYMNTTLPWRIRKVGKNKAKDCIQELVSFSVSKNIDGSLLPPIQWHKVSYSRLLQRRDLFSWLRYRDQVVHVKLTRKQIDNLTYFKPLYGEYKIAKTRTLYYYSNIVVPKVKENPYFISLKEKKYTIAVTGYTYAGGGGYMASLFIPRDRKTKQYGFFISMLFHYLQHKKQLPKTCDFFVYQN